jgi:hypothetical protein
LGGLFVSVIAMRTKLVSIVCCGNRKSMFGWVKRLVVVDSKHRIYVSTI